VGGINRNSSCGGEKIAFAESPSRGEARGFTTEVREFIDQLSSGLQSVKLYTRCGRSPDYPESDPSDRTGYREGFPRYRRAGGMMEAREIKRQALNKRLANLTEEYIVAMDQIDTQLSNIDKLRSERAANDIFEEMKKIEKQIQELEVNDGNSIRQQSKFDKSLTKIDFHESRSIIDNIIRCFNKDGDSALLLLQNSLAMAGDLCLTILLDRLTEESITVKRIEIDLVERKCALNEAELLKIIAEAYKLNEFIDGSEIYALSIIQKIRSSLQNGSTVFFNFQKLDSLDKNDPGMSHYILDWFMKYFWIPLIQELPDIGKEYRNVKFVSFVSMRLPLPDKFSSFSYCNKDEPDPKKILELPLCNWEEEDIKYWLDNHSPLKNNLKEPYTKQIYKASFNGIPDLVMKKLREDFEEKL
jgi:Effector-associated domain 9/inactive STAND